MTPYKGIVKIECGRLGACPSKRRGDVKAICVQCRDATIEILDLDGKTLARKTPENVLETNGGTGSTPSEIEEVDHGL
jgi:hypothetical protein